MRPIKKMKTNKKMGEKRNNIIETLNDIHSFVRLQITEIQSRFEAILSDKNDDRVQKSLFFDVKVHNKFF